MKRKQAMICALLALLTTLPMGGQAADKSMYSVSEIREQAKDGWHKTYEAHGRTIAVNVPIHVPEVDAFPLLKVSPMPPSMVAPITKQGSKWGDIEHGIETNNMERRMFEYFNPDNKFLNERHKPDSYPKNISLKGQVLGIDAFDMDTPYSFKNPATVRDVDAMLRQVWSAYFPGEASDFMPYRVATTTGAQPYDIDKMEYYGEEWVDFQGSLRVNFNQLLRGIPLAGTMEKANGQTYMNTLYSNSGPFIMGNLGDLLAEDGDALAQHAIFWTVKEDAVLTDDLPLCSIDKVIAAYEGLIDKGQLRRVDNLRLCYIGWYDKRGEDDLILLPVWVAEGVLMKKADKEPYYGVEHTALGATEFKDVMVNAQTGELIDPWDDRKNRAFEVPKIIRWK